MPTYTVVYLRQWLSMDVVSNFGVERVWPGEWLWIESNGNKSSAVAETGDRDHNRHGPKRWGLLCLFRAELGPRLIQCGLGRGLYFRSGVFQVASSSIQPFGHNKHGPNTGWWWAYPLFWGSWVPIKHKVAWAKAYLHTKCHLSPSSRLDTTDIGRKLGALSPF